MFDDMWRGFDSSVPARTPSRAAFGSVPAVAIDDSETAIEITVELPGLREKDVDLTLDGDTLTIKGEKREEKADKKTGYSERWYGSFERSVALPAGLVIDKADAKFKDGVLTISVPKSAQSQAKAKKIAIARS